MKTKPRCFLLTLVLVLALAPVVIAQMRPLTEPLGRLGPINTYVPSPDGGVTPATGNGFPLWVEDINGVALDLPVKPYGDGVNAPTLIFEPPIVGNQLSQDTGFGGEAFFYLANSVINLPNGGRAVLDLGIEAAYGAGDPLDGDQFLFARVRVRFDATVAGTYTVTHPWGVENLVLTAADVGQRFTFVYDWGGLAPLCPLSETHPSCFGLDPGTGLPISESPGFERILVSPKPWVFLEAATKVVQGEPVEMDWIIGDGVTATTLLPTTFGPTGPPVVTTFTITGPANAFGTTNTVTTDQFTVSGHIAGADIPTAGTPPPPVEQQADTVTITRARLRGAQVEVRATSSNGFPMTAELYEGGVGGTLVGSANLGTNGRGNITFTGGTPDTVRVHSTSTNPDILGGQAIAPITN